MNEWARLRLDEVADRVAVKNTAGHDRVMTVSAAHGLIDQGRFFSKRIASANLDGYWVIEPGDFVYNKSTSKDAPWGVVAQYEGDSPAVVTSLYFAFRAKEHVVDPKYLLLACNGETFFDSLQGRLREGARSHGLLNVRLKEFYSAAVPLPPLAEQRRIVDVMAAVDAQIEALVGEGDAAAHTLHVARLALLTTGPGVDLLSASTDSNSTLDWTTNLPQGWTRATVGAVATVRSGATPLRARHERYFEGGVVRWVKTGDLNERLIHETDERITAEAVNESSARLLPVDTVLVAMYGGFGQIGRTARLAEPATTNQAISALTEIRADVLPAFLHEVLKAGRPKWRLVAASSRKDPNITKKDVEAFDFPLPPLEQQVQIVELLEEMQGPLDALDAELATLRAFHSTLLTSLLNQEIEIPASYDALLEAVS